ncbi:hypothetical protein O3G_MSEX008534 [Manduca sexta]|uniref:Reverse transcriptase n=1 Tax=Manduca sexta TaxID=7130 RepID=A0A922CQJ4_MANSE|nr:hypothetical protein O3G_MSEX008534 [Manduca sexta]
MDVDPTVEEILEDNLSKLRRLNDKTIDDKYPLPNIADLFVKLGNAKYFSTIYFASGYHQIKVDKADQAKTAFTTQSGARRVRWTAAWKVGLMLPLTPRASFGYAGASEPPQAAPRRDDCGRKLKHFSQRKPTVVPNAPKTATAEF